MADAVRNQTDKELAKMEKHLASIFAEAEKDLIKKANDYLSKFEKLDEDKKSKVEEGKLTQKEYDEWRKNKLLYGEHWTRLISAVQNEMVNCNKTAIDYVNGKTAEIFAMNYNSIAEKIEESDVKGYSFEMVDAETVRQLATSGELMLPHKDLDEEKDKRWNAKQVNSQVLQGVLQGESIPKIAQRMANVCNNDKVAMVRTARTMITGAENSGRQAGMNKAADDGIIFWKMWIATSDERTRDSHNVLNGQVIPNDEKFVTINEEELEFPGDWRADGCEVYNCRCSLGSIIKGFNKKRLDEAIEEQQAEPEVEEQQKYNDEEMISRIGEFRNEYGNLDPDKQDEIIKETGKYIANRASEFIEDINSNYSDSISELTQKSKELDKIYFEYAKIRDELKPEKEELKALINAGEATPEQIERYNELIKILTECNKKINDSIDSQIPIDDRRRDLERQKAEEIEKSMTNLLSEIRKCGGNISNRNIGILDKNDYNGKDARDMISDVLNKYPSEWVELSKSAGKLMVGSSGRGYYNHYSNELVIEETRWTGRPTAYHELGHRFEFIVPGLADAEKRFYERRTEGEELVKLNDVIPNGGYDDEEVTKVDNFLNPYTGKYYNGEFFEVVSMGFEDFFTNPERLMKDSDFAEFISGILCVI